MSSILTYLPSIDHDTSERLVLSAVLMILAIALREILERTYICRLERSDRHGRRFAMRAIVNALLAATLVALWASHLQSVMLSLAAVMVAFVIAAKELIMCGAGAVLRVGGHMFRVGDRIAVRNLHGEVVDHGIFSTTLMELPSVSSGHAGTGRMVVLPNSVFLTDAVRIEAKPRHYAPHAFRIVLDQLRPTAPALTQLHALISDLMAADAERAERFHSLATNRNGFETAGPAPTISVSTSDLGKLHFDISIYCLVEQAADLESRVNSAFLDWVIAGERSAGLAVEAPYSATGNDFRRRVLEGIAVPSSHLADVLRQSARRAA